MKIFQYPEIYYSPFIHFLALDTSVLAAIQHLAQQNRQHVAALQAEVNILKKLRKTSVPTNEQNGTDKPQVNTCLLYTSPSPRDKRQSRMPSSA